MYSTIIHLLVLFVPVVSAFNTNEWLWRLDGTGTYVVNDTIVQSFPCATPDNLMYSNSEIYNNPCCQTELQQICDSLGEAPRKKANVSCPIVTPSYDKQLCQVMQKVCTEDWNPDECHLFRNPVILDYPIQYIQMIKDTYLNTPYLYNTVETEIKVTGLVNGSRGWGFWNTAGFYQSNRMACFFQMNAPGYPFNGFWAVVQNGKDLSLNRIPDLDEQRHSYRVAWKPESITFFIDDKVVHTETDVLIPDRLSYHTWVDNAVFGFDKIGIIQHYVYPVQREKNNVIYRLDFS